MIAFILIRLTQLLKQKIVNLIKNNNAKWVLLYIVRKLLKKSL
jgi:hypothetical protein